MNDQQKAQRIKIQTKAKALPKLLERRRAAIPGVVGKKMQDGTVFAGCTQEGRKLFAMPTDARLTMDFNAAAAYVKQMNNDKVLGHDDWRIPTKEELDLLHRNKDKGALKNSFTRGWWYDGTDGDYWSSTPAPTKSFPSMYVQRPADGIISWYDIRCYAALRCVR